MTEDTVLTKEEFDEALELVEEDLGRMGGLDIVQIQRNKNEILHQVFSTKSEADKIASKLAEYRLVNELDDLVPGRYIRWISLINVNCPKLTNGGIVVDTLMSDKGLYAVCKNKMNRVFQVNMGTSAVFQKMTDSEKLVTSLVEYASRNK